jgi:hypothetical protein
MEPASFNCGTGFPVDVEEHQTCGFLALGAREKLALGCCCLLHPFHLEKQQAEPYRAKGQHYMDLKPLSRTPLSAAPTTCQPVRHNHVATMPWVCQCHIMLYELMNNIT